MKTKNLWQRIQWAIWTDSGETYIDTGVKMLLGIVIGALLLTGLYGIFSDIILSNVRGTIQGFFDQTPTLNGGSGGGNGSGGNTDPEPTGFPIAWNTVDVMDNIGIYFEGEDYPVYVKVSDYTPTTEEMLKSKIAFSGVSGYIYDEPYIMGDGATFFDYSSVDDYGIIDVMVATKAGVYDGVNIPEAGFYVLNVGGLYGENVDFVIDVTGHSGGANDDNLPYAYALVLNNSADANDAMPMIFVREDETPIVGECYNSETYGELPVVDVFTDFEDIVPDYNPDLPWYENYSSKNANNPITSVIVEDKISPEDIKYWFNEFRNCCRMDVKKIDVSKCTDMTYTFASCEKVSALDLSTWDVSNVVSMDTTFSGMTNLRNLDLTGWDTSSLTYMSYMFAYCTSLDYFKIEFDTSKVEYFNYLFSGWDAYHIDVSGIDTSSAIGYRGMFAGCKNVIELDLSNFKTTNKPYIADMFSNCTSLKTIYASHNWSYSDSRSTICFYNCDKLVGAKKFLVGDYGPGFCNYQTGYFTYKAA